jgi:DNA-binding phage protein
MPTDPLSPFARSRFLPDKASRILALRDALATGDATEAARAFQSVALACGMSQLANDSGVARDQLFDVLADPSCLQVATLAHATDILAERWAAAPKQDRKQHRPEPGE